MTPSVDTGCKLGLFLRKSTTIFLVLEVFSNRQFDLHHDTKVRQSTAEHPQALLYSVSIFGGQRETCLYFVSYVDMFLIFQDLIVDELPEFVANLNKTVQEESKEIVNSSATISAVVDILGTIATVSIGSEVSKSVIEVG